MNRAQIAFLERGARYGQLFNERERDEIYTATEKLAHLIKERDIKNVIFIDASARPISTGLTTYWHKAFPQEHLPGIYFVNPEGFHSKNQDTKSLEEEERRIAMLLGTSVDKLPGHSHQVPPGTVERLQDAQPYLTQHKDQPTLVVDTCLHTGHTVQNISRTLKAGGFGNVTIATVSPDPDTTAKADISLLPNEAKLSCYPFGAEGLIAKGEDVLSQPTSDSEQRTFGNLLRQEIKDIIEERFASPN